MLSEISFVNPPTLLRNLPRYRPIFRALLSSMSKRLTCHAKNDRKNCADPVHLFLLDLAARA
jgi:hypothetical protein